MSKCYFAKLNDQNIVIDTVVVGGDVNTSSGPLSENPMHVDGETWCQNNISQGNWKQCSDSGAFRGNFPGQSNYYYNSDKDKFIPNKPYDNFVLNETTWLWEAPLTNRPTTESYAAIEGKNLFPGTWNPDTQRLEATNNLDLTEETIYYWDDINSVFISAE